MSVVLVVLAYVVFAITSVALAVIDARTHRLPDRVVLPAYPIALLLLGLGCLLGWPWEALLRGLIGGAALFVFYFLLRLAQPRGMGGGDVKLAGLVGLHLAFLGWEQLAVGAFAGFLLGASTVCCSSSRGGRGEPHASRSARGCSRAAGS